jgi:hypothetical protein
MRLDKSARMQMNKYRIAHLQVSAVVGLGKPANVDLYK